MTRVTMSFVRKRCVIARSRRQGSLPTAKVGVDGGGRQLGRDDRPMQTLTGQWVEESRGIADEEPPVRSVRHAMSQRCRAFDRISAFGGGPIGRVLVGPRIAERMRDATCAAPSEASLCCQTAPARTIPTFTLPPGTGARPQ